jgi:hypothetical protein
MTRTVGVILIVLGLLGLAWGGLNYTTREKVVDVGPIHATREETHNVPFRQSQKEWRSLAAL